MILAPDTDPRGQILENLLERHKADKLIPACTVQLKDTFGQMISAVMKEKYRVEKAMPFPEPPKLAVTNKSAWKCRKVLEIEVGGEKSTNKIKPKVSNNSDDSYMINIVSEKNLTLLPDSFVARGDYKPAELQILKMTRQVSGQ